MGMKFIRGLIYPSTTANGRCLPWRLKWIYEFWGFCINGTSSLTSPGGFASNNGVQLPANFTGGTSLLASGSDGYYNATTASVFSGDCVFSTASSSPFTPGMAGKAIVIWKENSNSSEDSIYLITQVLNASQIVININTGGTPDITTKHPSVTSRSSLNYRVIDPEIAYASVANAGDGNCNLDRGGFMVLNTDAGSINAGQSNSQIQFTMESTGNYLVTALSGTGSWNGNTLSVSGATNVSPIQITTSTTHGLTSGQTVNIKGVNGNTAANGCWIITVTGTNTFTLIGSTGNGAYTSGGTVYNGFQNDGYNTTFWTLLNVAAAYGSGQCSVNMIGDKTFLIAHIKDQDISQANRRLNIYFEIPTRLYPQQNDLHPIVCLIETVYSGSLNTNSPTASYGGGFVMRTHSSDIVTARAYRTLVKALRGDGTPDVFGQGLSDYRIGYNTIYGTVPMSEAVLALTGVTNQYSIARVKLRNVRFTGTHIPAYHRLGINGEWIQMQNGICWPWDNTIIPTQLLVFGAG